MFAFNESETRNAISRFLGLPYDEITKDGNLLDLCDQDKIKLVGLYAAVSDALGSEFFDYELKPLITVGDLINLTYYKDKH